MTKLLSLQVKAAIAMCLCLAAFGLNAQDCGCDIEITPDVFNGTNVIDGSKPIKGKVPKGGDKVCLMGPYTRSSIVFRNFRGSPGNPIVITNCGGKYVVNGVYSSGDYQPYSIKFDHSKYFRLTGGESDNPNDYGIEVIAGHQGVMVTDSSTNAEVDHLHIHNQGFAGIMAKTDPGCDESTWRENFTMKDLKIHHNWIHHTYRFKSNLNRTEGGEGMYVGFSFYATQRKITCINGNDTIIKYGYAHAIHDAKIYKNIVHDTGSDGIQVGACTSGCEIYDNTIIRHGQYPFWGQNGPRGDQGNGIQLGEGTGGKCYNNYIENIPPPNAPNKTGWSIICLGQGDNQIYNNVMVNGNYGGIFIDERPPATNNSYSFKFVNNTIVNASTVGILNYADQVQKTYIKNNIIHVKAGAKYIDRLSSNVQMDSTNNYETRDIATIKFKDAAAKDYHLLSNSPALNAGMNASVYGVTADFDGVPRPQGIAYDIGAFEFGSTGGLPVANAGDDRTITLPSSSTTLNGSASDPGGSITSWLWTQVSGPNTATISTPNASSTSVSGLVAGTYVFRLRATDNDSNQDTDDVSVNVIGATSWEFYLNAGGDVYTHLGKTWEKDKQLEPHAYLDQAYNSYATGSTSTYSGPNTTTAPSQVLGTYRYTANVNNILRYNIPVPVQGAQYRVTLFFAKKNGDTFTSGARRFDIYIEGVRIREAFDVYDNTLSGATSITHTLNVYDGTLNLSFEGVQGGHVQINDITLAKISTPPVANAGTDESITLPVTTATLSGSGSDGDGPVTFQWSQVSGPNAAAFESPSSPTTNVSGLVQGTYVFRLTVKDNENNTVTDDISLQVKAATSSWALFIDSGGDEVIANGNTWERDKQLTPHPTLNQSYNSYATGSASSFSGGNFTGAPDAVLGSYRYTSNSGTTIRYDIPVPVAGATYQITMYFARKTNDTFTSGVRRFDIEIEGLVAEGDFDVYDRAGGEASSFSYTTVSDNVLNLAFIATPPAHAQVNAIHVEKVADPDPSEISLFINSGGDTYQDDDNIWERDRQTMPHAYLDQSTTTYATGGTASFFGSNSTDAPSETLGSNRYSTTGGSVKYAIPVPSSGNYHVKLFFARKSGETYTSGGRRFDIKLEGNTVRAAYDIYDIGGTAATEFVYTINVTDGTLNVELAAVSGSIAQVNDISVTGPVTTPVGQGRIRTNEVTTTVAEETSDQAEIRLYPNPARDYVEIVFAQEGEHQIRFVNTLNQELISETYRAEKGEVRRYNIASFASTQIYLVYIRSAIGKVRVEKILKGN
jgi:hypothetical protein